MIIIASLLVTTPCELHKTGMLQIITTIRKQSRNGPQQPIVMVFFELTDILYTLITGNGRKIITFHHRIPVKTAKSAHAAQPEETVLILQHGIDCITRQTVNYRETA